MMPKMDGFQLLGELKKRNIQIPVVVTTGFSTLENAVKSLYDGAIDFLPKPFTVDELLSCVQRGLNYGEILGLYHKNETVDKLSYVHCPVAYYRMGYNSWVSIQNDGAIRVGVTDLFLKTIKTISNIEFQSIDSEVIQGNACAQIETKANLIHNILSPISGRIINVNEKIKEQQDLIEKDPYFEGWFYTIIPSDLEYELKHLISCSSDR
jgi:glycine cleavage system H protein